MGKCTYLISGFPLRSFAITKNTEHTFIAVGAAPAFTTPPYPPQYGFGRLTNRWFKYHSESNDTQIKKEILKTKTNECNKLQKEHKTNGKTSVYLQLIWELD